jgi:hypothetical protein
VQFWFALCFVLVACGSSSSPSKTDGRPADTKSVDAPTYDFGCATGSACTLDQVCCAMPGATTTFACTATASCPRVDQITCDGPDECGGATPTCCGVYQGDGTGSYPNCGIATLGTSCTATADCPTHLESTCSDTTKVQLCHVKADCTDPTDKNCCTFTSGAAQLTFCIDTLTAAAAHAICH